MHKKQLTLFLVLIILLLPSLARAYEIVKGEGDGKWVEVFSADINKDGVMETIVLNKKDTRGADVGTVNGVLVITEGDYAYTQNLGIISRHSSEIQKLVIADTIKPFIVVSSFASGSAHAWYVDLYSFDGKRIRKELELFSDAPSIEVEDVDKDGIKEILVKERDYDYFAPEDRYIKTYKYVKNKWKLISIYRTKTKEYIPLDEYLKGHGTTAVEKKAGTK